MPCRQRFPLDCGWKFKLAEGELLAPPAAWMQSGDYGAGATGRQFDDAGWQAVDLPHDFVLGRPFVPEGGLPEHGRVSSAMNGSRPGAVGWYRKSFALAEDDRELRTILHFDGVFRDSRVYLNEFYVGHHLSGYTSFVFDVTDLVGPLNLLAVRVDATQHEGWWYEGGGIYRHVWLERVAPLHVAPWGTFVAADVDLAGPQPQARLDVSTTLVNRTGGPVFCRLRSTVLDPGGQPVAEVETPVDVAAWRRAEVRQEAGVAPAALWSLETPHLYTLVTTVVQDGRAVDEHETTFGLRTIRFDPDEGFFLNGQPVKIKGVCCHQDHAGVGIAIPDQLHEFRLRRLKEMGCNAYRSAHHPATPALLDACDRLGLLVMDENRLLSSAAEDLGQLESMVRRDRNHPCVILWSLGNESVRIQWTEPSARIARTMRNTIRALDPTRPVTLAICYWNPASDGIEPLARTPLPAAEIDVMGFNYAPEHWEGYHQAHPAQPLVVSEATTSLRTRGCYQSDHAAGHVTWDDPGAQPFHEEQWEKVARHPYLSGTFLWTGLDYRGEPTPHGWPAISSHFGVMDTCGFPKDNYYYYKACWSDEPLVHVFPHWNWPDRVGQPIKVYAYTNCDEVELFVNGASQGRATVEPCRHVEWPAVTYEPGLLEAKGYRGGREVAGARVETTGAPHAIRLAPDRDGIHANGQDVAVVTVQVVDGQGRVVPTADDDVTFHVEGPGRVLGVGNGDPASHEPDGASRRRAFNGLCQVILQAGDEPGVVALTARSPALQAASVQIRAEQAR